MYHPVPAVRLVDLVATVGQTRPLVTLCRHEGRLLDEREQTLGAALLESRALEACGLCDGVSLHVVCGLCVALLTMVCSSCWHSAVA
ncbi:hypothetical protein PSV08DRAFT_289202 [Bipolaris maydis]|uniref:uncharacterized protein n=1 Tax=Cochliobolus heterostrophus TaxID=5016 RepID=UPI0024D46419|nr:hypothetical protein J3E73DRAFT_345738 [Bipolaris maydis]KAJ6272270.1 hypothetical protein PSV08DRAFT_289202 [Bipolaris maydis]KAJ6281638.1 hypothetical protein J3E71DRAFT_291444 [Bipolaris maydis]